VGRGIENAAIPGQATIINEVGIDLPSVRESNGAPIGGFSVFRGEPV
jgi:hypothetical protein